MVEVCPLRYGIDDCDDRRLAVDDITREQILGITGSHVKAVNYAKRFIDHKNPETLTDEEVVDRLMAKYHTNKYKSSTIVQIARIIKSLDRNRFMRLIGKIMNRLGYVKPPQGSSKYDRFNHDGTRTKFRVMSERSMEAINFLILDCASTPEEFNKIAPAVLMCICTNLRMGELLQLRRSNLDQIYSGDLVQIKIKKRARLMHIIGIPPLLDRFKAYFYSICDRDPEARDCKDAGRLIQHPPSVINKIIRRELNIRGGDLRELFGIQCLRAFNTTRLLASSDISAENVAKFNRHRNVNTTIKFYSTGLVVPQEVVSFDGFL